MHGGASESHAYFVSRHMYYQAKFCVQAAVMWVKHLFHVLSHSFHLPTDRLRYVATGINVKFLKVPNQLLPVASRANT